MFRSMRSIGNNETAKVNAAFADRFEIFHKTLKTEVEKDCKKGKQIVFAGHSSGGPMAIFATLWFLENTKKPESNQIPFRCLTFGSPLTGDKIFGHAIKRENWSRNFTHFVMKYDIVPRIMLAPVSHIEQELPSVLNFLKYNKTTVSQIESRQAQDLFRKVMKNASSVASYAATTLMGCPNMLLETFSTFNKISPYRPFGKYIFCTGNGRLVVVENSDAVLQMLFYTSQLDSEARYVETALKSLHEHMSYEKELQDLEMKKVIPLNQLQNLPLSSVGNTLDQVSAADKALNDLGLVCVISSTPACKRKMEDNMIEGIGMPDDLIKRACSASMKAHKLSGKQYLRSKIRGSPDVVFAFAGSWSVNEFFKHKSFGEKDIDLEMFRSMRSIGPNETAQVNAAFVERYKIIHKTLKIEVDKDRKKGKQIVFAGHSSGGPMAIFATLWFLENTNRTEGDQVPFHCLTFGSPLTGDKIFGHAIRRENWSRNFTHFVMKHDIVPRIMLAPLAHIEGELQKVLNFFKNYKTAMYPNDLLQPQVLFREVMKNASSVASYAASILTGCPNMLLETLSNYIELSPYKPFGKYIFCTGNGKLVVVENSDAVLQMLFYSSQLDSEAQDVEIAWKSLHEHMSYEKGLQESLAMNNLFCLNHLQNLPLSSVGDNLNKDSTDMALTDLGLSARARLCLRAAGEFEDQKKRNQSKIDKYEVTIAKALNEIEAYQIKCEGHNKNYYDAFKRQKDNKIDFEANIKRIELSGIWDEIIDLLQNYELPDEFEGRQNWIKLGTEFRQLVEPLDIANYYRHLKNDDCGPYMGKGRPRRYKFTQRWSEHASKTDFGSISSSSFWAEVEELRNEKFEDIKEKLEALEKALQKWQVEGKLGKHVFSDGSTVAEWWKTFPDQYRSISCLAQYMTN